MRALFLRHARMFWQFPMLRFGQPDSAVRVDSVDKVDSTGKAELVDRVGSLGKLVEEIVKVVRGGSMGKAVKVASNGYKAPLCWWFGMASQCRCR